MPVGEGRTATHTEAGVVHVPVGEGRTTTHTEVGVAHVPVGEGRPCYGSRQRNHFLRGRCSEVTFPFKKGTIK